MSVLSMFGGVTRRLRPVNRDVVAHCRRRRLLQSDASRAGCHAELPGRHAARHRPATPGQQRRRVDLTCSSSRTRACSALCASTARCTDTTKVVFKVNFKKNILKLVNQGKITIKTTSVSETIRKAPLAKAQTTLGKQTRGQSNLTKKRLTGGPFPG